MQDFCLNVDFIQNAKFPRLIEYTKRFAFKHLDAIKKRYCK